MDWLRQLPGYPTSEGRVQVLWSVVEEHCPQDCDKENCVIGTILKGRPKESKTREELSLILKCREEHGRS